MMTNTQLIQDDCENYLRKANIESTNFDFTFLDPPFNQGKQYREHNDSMADNDYWDWMKNICRSIYNLSSTGAAIYFMQREKNSEQVMRVIRESGWTFQNLIIWRKKTSAIPSTVRYSKSYQIIVFATKGYRPRIFNRLRIDPPLLNGYTPRDNGIYVPDVWDDIRELTSGYYAGNEALRSPEGGRIHKQQSPVDLLLRMILSSTYPGDCVFDPFCGTGTTLVVAAQLGRFSIGVEKDPINANCIANRLENIRQSDALERRRALYYCTPQLDDIWPAETILENQSQMALC